MEEYKVDGSLITYDERYPNNCKVYTRARNVTDHTIFAGTPIFKAMPRSLYERILFWWLKKRGIIPITDDRQKGKPHP